MSTNACSHSKLTLNNSLNSLLENFSQSWFHNLTNVEISQKIIEIVSLGPKFSNSSMNKPLILDTIKNVESFLNNNKILSNNTKMNLIRAFIDEVNSSLGYTGHITREDRLFAKNFGLTKYFSKDKEILFPMAVFILNQHHFQNKCLCNC